MVNSFDSLHVDLIQSQIQQQTGYFKFGHFFLPSALDGEEEHQQQGKLYPVYSSQKSTSAILDTTFADASDETIPYLFSVPQTHLPTSSYESRATSQS